MSVRPSDGLRWSEHCGRPSRPAPSRRCEGPPRDVRGWTTPQGPTSGTEEGTEAADCRRRSGSTSWHESSGSRTKKRWTSASAWASASRVTPRASRTSRPTASAGRLIAMACDVTCSPRRSSLLRPRPVPVPSRVKPPRRPMPRPLPAPTRRPAAADSSPRARPARPRFAPLHPPRRLRPLPRLTSTGPRRTSAASPRRLPLLPRPGRPRRDPPPTVRSPMARPRCVRSPMAHLRRARPIPAPGAARPRRSPPRRT